MNETFIALASLDTPEEELALTLSTNEIKVRVTVICKVETITHKGKTWTGLTRGTFELICPRDSCTLTWLDISD